MLFIFVFFVWLVRRAARYAVRVPPCPVRVGRVDAGPVVCVRMFLSLCGLS